jgi:hypothetical protein
LKKDPTGSLTIVIQKDRPGDTSHWLPALAGVFVSGSSRFNDLRRDANTEALIDEFGIAACSEARRREHEASSNAIALAWSELAPAVAREKASVVDQDTSIRITMDAGFARTQSARGSNQEDVTLWHPA